MSTVTRDNFGPLIAYLVPGATVLWGLSYFSTTLQSWFASAPPDVPSLGGFLYLTVASVATGMTVNAVRWGIIDTIHLWTGLPPPPVDFSRLGKNVEAFTLLIEIHYKHYQYHANMAVATAIAYICYRISLGSISQWGWADAGVAALEVIFIGMSRDTLRKYHLRGSQVLGSRRPKSSKQVQSSRP